MKPLKTLTNIILSLLAGAGLYVAGTDAADAQEVFPQSYVEECIQQETCEAVQETPVQNPIDTAQINSFYSDQERAFNDSAFNLGFAYLWKDLNNDKAVQKKELSNVPDMLSSDDELLGNSIRLSLDAIAEVNAKKAKDHVQILKNALELADQKYKSNPTPDNKEKLRQKERDYNFASREVAPMNVDFSTLDPALQKVAYELLYKVGPLVDQIYFLQIDPKNREYRIDLIRRGDLRDYMSFKASGGPWCLGESKNPEICTSHPGFPKRDLNALHWPKSASEGWVDLISKTMSGSVLDAMISPFVDRTYSNEIGSPLDWRSTNMNPAHEKELKELSQLMIQTSMTEGLDSSIANFLMTRGYEFLDARNPFPFFGGDLRWRNIDSLLELLIGFYETYKSSYGTNAMMESSIGVRTEKYDPMISMFKSLVPGAEKDIANSLGKVYTMRDFSKELPVIIVTYSINLGDGSIGYFAIACKLPNVAIYGRSDLTKISIFANNMEARQNLILKPMSYVLMETGQAERTGIEGLLKATIGHEVAHSLGPNEDYITTTGKRVSDALGKYSSTLEEAKADLLGIALLKDAYDRGMITKDELEDAVLSMMPTYARGLSYGLEDAHGIGNMIQLAELYKRGAIVETKDKDGKTKYALNLESPDLYEAFRNAAMDIIEIQMRGDYEAAKDLVENAASRLPENLKKEILPALKSMPKDLRPWYSPIFSPSVEREMYEKMRTAK